MRVRTRPWNDRRVHEQQRYQVRFDWGVPGARAVAADADVIVWVDAAGPVPVPLAELPGGCAVVATGLAGAADAASWVLALQEHRQRRTSVAVVAAGAPRDGGLRFAVEDLLAAGALVDALEARGIDAMSPEAAAADAAYRVLASAVRSLLRSVVEPGQEADGLQVLRDHPERTATA